MRKVPKKLLLLDFDGVIVNSIDECLLTSYNAFQQFENTGVSLTNDLSNIPLLNQKYFISNRSFVKPAAEYYLLHSAFKKNIEIINIESYNDLLMFHKDKLLDYQDVFFNERNRLRLINKKKWLRLHSVYNNLEEGWGTLSQIFNIFIVSNKDKNSIILLMDYFKLPINENRIFGAENGNDKSIIIEDIISKTSINPEYIYFIDDIIDNLKSVKYLNIKLYHAMWGYGNTEENNDSIIEEIYSMDMLQGLI
jgi:phosphoglycolate phosphatase-like HAD superfamily hydrolase